MKTKLKVGFDMDGVILYNPFRIARAPLDFINRLTSRKEALSFFYPRSPYTKMLWRLVHLSSLFVAPGYEDVKRLIDGQKMEGYIVTARYNFLRDDFEKWLIKLKAHNQMVASFHNENDEQPHLYKERMIEKLELDVFIEDNWDIVSHLNKRFAKKKKRPVILWIYNIVDRFIPYEYKYPTLEQAVKFLEKRYL